MIDVSNEETNKVKSNLIRTYPQEFTLKDPNFRKSQDEITLA
jgi:hypothetical protein